MSGVVQYNERLFDTETDTTTSKAVYIGGSTGHFSMTDVTLVGTTPNITLTYSLSDSRDGTFVTPSDAVDIVTYAAATANNTINFTPLLNRFIKIIATKNSGTITDFSANLTFTEGT